MKKMLIVEDDDLSIKVLRRIFRADYEMDVCESFDEYRKS
jgi:ActR/RegA family two-component response regulator